MKQLPAVDQTSAGLFSRSSWVSSSPPGTLLQWGDPLPCPRAAALWLCCPPTSRDARALRDSGGQAHPVISAVKDRVELTDENVAQNPERSTGRVDVQPLEAAGAEGRAVALLLGKERKAGDEPRASCTWKHAGLGLWVPCTKQGRCHPLRLASQLPEWLWATFVSRATGNWGQWCRGSCSRTMRV